LSISLTETIPKHERYGIISQIQRAGVSIASNIAEGSKRNSKKEFIQFLSIAQGSAAELETQLLILREINIADNPQVNELLLLLDEIMRIIGKLIYTLKT
jgi:four helix bundle protein